MRPATLLRSALVLAVALAGFGWASDAQAQSQAALHSAGPAPITSVPDVSQNTVRGGESSIAYGVNNGPGTYDFVSFDFMSPGSVTTLSSGSAAPFVGAGAVGVDESVAYQIDGTVLFSVNTGDGAVTQLGNLGTAQSFSGMTYDPTTGTFYGLTTDITTSNLFEIDVDAVSATSIGEVTNAPGAIALAATPDGSLYTYDIVADVLLSVDKSTGAGTVIGNIGFDANFGQGMTYDFVNDVLYMTAFNNTPGVQQPELRSIDTSTGNTTLVGVLGVTQMGWAGAPAPPAGDGPELTLSPSEINATVVTEQTTNVSLTISNIGSEELTFSFSGLRGGTDVVDSVMPESGTVPAGGSQSVSVVLTAEGLSPNTYTDDITLTTNDEDEGTVNIPITLEVTDVPGISFNPNPLVEMLETGETGTETVQLTNNTDGPVMVTFPQFDGGLRPAAPSFPSLDLAKGEADPRQGTAQLRGMGGPDDFGYTWIDSNEPGGPPANAFDDISGTGTAVTWTETAGNGGNFPAEDEGFADIALPFTFSYYGQDYSSVRVFTNGFLTFDGAYDDPDFNSFSNQPVPDPAEPNAALYPFWDDLTLEDPAANVFFETSGGEAVIQFNAGRFLAAEPTYFFQVVLNASGSIEYRYGSMSGTLDSHTVGFENEDGTDGLQIGFNDSYAETGLTVLISSSPGFVTDVTPSSGTIPSGATVPVTVTFDATDLNGGTYEASLRVETNIDDDESTFELPVVLIVGGEADCVISPDPLDFGPVTVGESATETVTVSNNGTDSCTLDEVSFDDDAFSSDFDGSVEVAPGGSTSFDVTFEPEEAGAVTATLTIDVEDGDDLTSTVQGSGGSPPDFNVDPEELDFTVVTGEVSDAQTITLSNDGDGDGTYSVSAVVLRPSGVTPTETTGPVARQSEIVTDPEVLPQTNAPTRSGDIVADGSFEQGTPNPDWEEFSSNFGTPLCDEGSCGTGGGSGPFDGQFWTWFGGIGGAEEQGSMEQEVTIPSGNAMLSFWHEIPAVGTTGFMSVTMDGDEVFRSTDADADMFSVYAQVMVDVSAYADGGTHTLRFESTTDAGAGATNFFVDLVEITSEAGLLISVDPDEGSVDAGDSEELSVVVDATNAEPGEYDAEITIATEPGGETLTVDVSVSVTLQPNAEETGIPTAFSLSQNYPNPFADETTIKYALPEAARVTITVYDAVGRQVATLVDEDRTAGFHEAQWATRGLASGVYFYRIEAGTYSRTLKMSLVR